MPIAIKSESGSSFCPCAVTECVEDRGGLLPITEPAHCEGEYTLRFPERTHILKIDPEDGHWSMSVEISSADDEIRCISMGDTDFPWWQVVVGAKRPAVHSARRIKIGLIDVLFRPGAELKHLRLLEPERLEAFASVPAEGHGRVVSAVLAGRGPGKYCGLARDAEAFFLDASVSDDEGVPSDTRVDHARVLDGIRNLSENHGVDIINLSCGFDTKDDLPDLEDAIEDAADRGTICICAAGNAAWEPVAVPARYDAAVAVAGIGFTGVAEFPTFVGRLARVAERERLLGQPIGTWPKGLPFLYHGTAWGPEIDVLGPSAGVILKGEGGRISEYYGTSYAAPIVAGVLACALSGDQIYRELSGRPRHAHALRRLGEISVDLGLNPPGSSTGLPLLRR
jgi:subtilisin